LAASLASGLLFALLAKPVFVAEGMLLIDAHRPMGPTLSLPASSQEQFALESAAVDSQVEMLKSEQLSRDVITKLGLATNPDIANPGFASAAFRALRNLVRGQPAPDAEIPAPIVKEFQSRLDVKRVRETYMISLRFKSGSPELAATVVNTIMQAHLDRQSELRRNSIRAELDWMDERLTELRGNISAADQALRQGSVNGSAQQDNSRLQREVESNRAVYQLILDRYTSSLQQMSFPYTQASIIAGARVPQEKSFPNASMVLVLSALAGLLIGLGLVAYLELTDDSFRSPQQVEATLGIPVIGLLPRPGATRRARSTAPPATNGRSNMAPIVRRIVAKAAPRSSMWERTVGILPRLISSMRNASGLSRTKNLPAYDDIDDYRYAADKPMSRFAEGLRSIKAAVDHYIENTSGRSIGFTSALPGEGAGVVAANCAYLIARTGKRVLLVDAEMRTGTLTAMIAGRRGHLADVISGRLSLGDATWRLADNLAFLGSSLPSGPSKTCYEVDTAITRSIIDQAAMQYDYVIVSLPPTAPLADLRSFAPALDALAVVVRWGATSQQAARDALALPSNIQGKLLGVVLNDVDFSRLASEAALATSAVAANSVLFEE
jgi:Mrp family chromosome partitioning ATPase